jgi:hypothetical protein
MNKKLLTLFIFGSFFSWSCASQQPKKGNFGQILGGIIKAVSTNGGSLSNDEVIGGLKEALQQGINRGSDSASRENGYFLNPKIKIPFPPEVQKVENTLRSLGLGGEVDKFVLALNRGAEEAAKEAKPIFIKAIFSMTFSDAWSILKGDKNAATMYLQRTTSQALMTAFSPIVDKALQKTQATKYYTDIATYYNKVPFVQRINPDLKAYATQKAIDGLFVLVAEEEARIRENPLARTTDLLKRVFGS